MKTCGKCNTEKDLFEFNKNKSKKDGHSNYCKKCSSNWYKKYYQSNKNKIKMKNNIWAKNNKEKRRKTAKLWYLNNKDKVLETYKIKGKDQKLKRLYNISLEEFNKLYKQQNGKCLICKKSEKTLCVDHNHQTNKIRGLLCNNCNTGLGLFQDNINILTSAINYLNL